MGIVRLTMNAARVLCFLAIIAYAASVPVSDDDVDDFDDDDTELDEVVSEKMPVLAQNIPKVVDHSGATNSICHYPETPFKCSRTTKGECKVTASNATKTFGHTNFKCDRIVGCMCLDKQNGKNGGWTHELSFNCNGTKLYTATVPTCVRSSATPTTVLSTFSMLAVVAALLQKLQRWTRLCFVQIRVMHYDAATV